MRTAACTWAERSLSGCPKVENASRASRGIIAQPARHAGGLDRDVGENLGIGHLVDRGVGDQHGAAARQHERDPHDAVAGLGIDAAADVLERHREIAGDPGHHGVGVAERHHAGGEMIAVLVDQAMHVAQQEAFALQPLIEIGRVGAVALGKGRIDDLDAVAELDPEPARGLAHPVLAADQERAAQSLMHEARGGADHLLLLALGEHHALRPPAQALVDALQDAGHRVAP